MNVEMARRASIGWAALGGFLVGIAVASWWKSSSTSEAPEGSVAAIPSTPPAREKSPLAAADSERITATRSASERNVASTASPGDAPAAPRTTLVYGRLLESEGTSLQHAKWAWVSMTNRAGRTWRTEAVGAAYALADLPLGAYDVSVQAASHRGADDRFELTANEPEVRKDLRLQPSPVLRVFVRTPEGEPFFEVLNKTDGLRDEVRDLVPVATVDPPGAHVYDVVGSLNNPFGVGQFWQQGPDGEFPPPGCIGYLTLARDPPVSVSLVFCHAVLRTMRVDPGREDVAFVLTLDDVRSAQSSFRVQVVDAVTSSPLQAYVHLDGGTRGVSSMQTDASGVLSIDPELPGRFELRIAKEGYEEFEEILDVEPGQATDRGVVALAREVVAELHFVDDLGRPAQASVVLAPLVPGTSAPDARFSRVLRSDAAGLLNLRGLGRKVYVLRTSNYDAAYLDSIPDVTWVSERITLDATTGSIPPMTIRLQPAVPLAIRVEGRTAEGLRFAVIDGQGRPLVRDRFWGNAPRPLRLPAGAYKVQLRDANDAVLAERSVALASEPVELALAP